jgi:hypothetical protein
MVCVSGPAGPNWRCASQWLYAAWKRTNATRCAWKRTNATRCARARSARTVLPVNEKVDVSRARTMMHGGWHARSGARHNEHVPAPTSFVYSTVQRATAEESYRSDSPNNMFHAYIYSPCLSTANGRCIPIAYGRCLSTESSRYLSTAYLRCRPTPSGRCLSTASRRCRSHASRRCLSTAARRYLSTAYGRCFSTADGRRLSTACRRFRTASRRRFRTAYRRCCAGILPGWWGDGSLRLWCAVMGYC